LISDIMQKGWTFFFFDITYTDFVIIFSVLFCSVTGENKQTWHKLQNSVKKYVCYVSEKKCPLKLKKIDMRSCPGIS